MKLVGRFKWLFVIFSVTCSFQALSQPVTSLTLEEAQQRARDNYPSIQQKGLLAETRSINIKNLNRNYLPQLSVSGQASYQSEVTRVNIPVPGFSVDPLSKDQYKFTADLNQILFDGGLTEQQKKLQKLNTSVEDRKIEVELYELRQRINELYLNVLYLDEQIKQAELIKNDLEIGISRTKAQVENGVSFRSNLDLLLAESLRADQRIIELADTKAGLIDALSVFLNVKLNSSTKFQIPLSPIISPVINRPELQLFSAQDSLLSRQKKLIFSRNLPKISVFSQGGYGRPGLNFLNNDFDWFYIAGLRLSWSLSGFYTYKNDRKLVEISQKANELRKETFLLNTNSRLSTQSAEIVKLEKLLEKDNEIIALREEVKNAAKAQLENGVITANDYLREVNAEDQVRQMRIAHQIQLLQAQIDYQYITGNNEN